MKSTAILQIDGEFQPPAVERVARIGVHSFPYIAPINLVPVVFFTAYWLAQRS